MITQRMRELGLVTPDEARHAHSKGLRRILIATEGQANTGKTEFMLSCPGPGAIVACDRGFDALFDNPTPPPTRRDDFGIKVMQMLTNNMSRKGNPGTEAAMADYTENYIQFRAAVYNYINEPSLKTVGIDGDNVSWETQRLANFGKLTGIYPTTKYSDPKADRRAFYHRLWDSGKIIIASNMVQEEWVDELDAAGNPILDGQGQPQRKPSGNYKAQGFPDQSFLWQIRIRHLFAPGSYNTILKRNVAPKWGLRILICKSRPALQGEEIWGADCTFAGLMSFVYPQIPLSEWGL